MEKYVVLEDCLCEHYIHEITKYPRPGLVEKKLYKGDVVTLIKEWSNFFGDYIRVEKDGMDYDIPPHKLQILKD